jgi:peptidoglycan/xylan/chitin deacetylase (PgdA/CDA1 family)
MTTALIYHDVAPRAAQPETGFAGAAPGRYKLTPEQFDAHLAAIAGAGVTVGLVPDRPQAALTFDDGGDSALVAAAALERRGWRGHFFITTGRIGTPGFVSAEEIRELDRRGHGVGSHSHSHPTYMGTLSAAELADEWGRSRAVLTEILGRAPVTAAVPGGFLSEQVIAQAAACGYTLLMTSQPTLRTPAHQGMAVHGRFTIWGMTTPSRAAAYARGDTRARTAMWLAWQGKTAAKRLNPAVYEGVRQRWARRGAGARPR